MLQIEASGPQWLLDRCGVFSVSNWIFLCEAAVSCLTNSFQHTVALIKNLQSNRPSQPERAKHDAEHIINFLWNMNASSKHWEGFMLSRVKGHWIRWKMICGRKLCWHSCHESVLSERHQRHPGDCSVVYSPKTEPARSPSSLPSGVRMQLGRCGFVGYFISKKQFGSI